jgi:predicted transcriptional regulator
MHLQDVLSHTEARPISHNPDLKREVRSGFASDLMSEVLCYDVVQGLLITGLTNPQIIRTADMADVAAILIVRGKVPPPETVDLAEQLDIPMIGTNLIMFETCGRLFAAGLLPCKRQNG